MHASFHFLPSLLDLLVHVIVAYSFDQVDFKFTSFKLTQTLLLYVAY